MNLIRIVNVSCRVLLEHRTRSLLAVASLAIGIALVIVINGIGQGVKSALLVGLDEPGARLLVVRPATTKRQPSRKDVTGAVTSLRLEDSTAIRRLASVTDVAPAVEGQFKVRSTLDTTTTMVVGTTDDMLRIKGYQVERGRSFDKKDNLAAARFAILGARVTSRLFPGDDPIGQVVRVRGSPFEVIGTLRARGASSDGSDHDDQILVPVRTAQRRVFDTQSLSGVFVSARTPGLLSAAEREIRQLLRQTHRLDRLKRPDDYTVQHQAKLSRVRQELARSLTLVTIALAAIALLVGGVGILGIMLLSVQERTAEIGLRTAVGARPRDIGLQFLTEAWLLTVMGGLSGTTIGLVGTWAVGHFTQWRAPLSLDTLALAFGIACATGLVAGVLPARKAARIPPVLAFAKE